MKLLTILDMVFLIAPPSQQVKPETISHEGERQPKVVHGPMKTRNSRR